MKQIEHCLYREKPVKEFDLNQTLYCTVKEQNKMNYKKDAIGFCGNNITYGELLKNVDKLADAYVKAGLREGDVVAICTINMPVVQENLLALSKIGVTSKWIDLRIKGKDLTKNINESNCKILVVFEGVLSTIAEIENELCVDQVLVVSPKDYLKPLIRSLAKLKDLKAGTQIKMSSDKRYILYRDFIKKGSVSGGVEPVPFKKNRPSLIVQSSGSTGKAKSIVHTEYNFNSAMQKEAYTDLPFAVGKTIHISIPPFIIYGLNNSIYAALVFGMKAEMTPYVSETTVYDDLGKFDFACAAPLHYRYLYKQIIELENNISKCEEEKDNNGLKRYKRELETVMTKMSRVAVFISGGDKITVQELLDMQRVFGKSLVNGYGNNEMAGAAVISPIYASKPASVGIPMKGITVAAFDLESCEELEKGEEGELCFSSDNLFVEYLNDEEETRRIKRVHAEGRVWIHTGDLGYVDDEGYVYVNGRSKRLIKRAAFKIAPIEIENVILSVPEIKECVVVGVPDLQEKEVPMAFVELNQESNGDFSVIQKLIEQRCALELPDYEIPKYIVNIDKMPYHNGKQEFKKLEQMGKEYVSSVGE